MGVGPDHGGNLSVQMPCHGDFLARRFSVDIHKDHRSLRAQSFGLLQCGMEWVVERLRHEGATLHIHDGNFPLRRIQDDAAIPRNPRRIVDRPQQARLGRKVGDDFSLVPSMVASRDHRHASAQKVDRDLRGNALALRGVLTVHHDKIHLSRLEHFRNHYLRRSPTGLADDVTKKEKTNHPFFL